MTPPSTARRASGIRLNSGERKLRAAIVTGTLVDLRTGDTRLDDPSNGAQWGDDRAVGAQLLAGLLTADLTSQEGRPRAIKLQGARIIGSLNLQAAELACPLTLQDCYLEEPINLNEASAPAIRLPGCHLPALNADQLRTTGSLELNGATVHGRIWISGARIGGQIYLSGAKLVNPGERVLHADLLSVEHSMICRHGFTAHGEIRISGARIGGRLDLREATLINPGGLALQAEGLNAEYGIICQNGFRAQGEIRLTHAHIGRVFDLKGASLANPSGVALSLRSADVTDLILLPEQPPDGIVNLTNTRVVTFSDDPRTWPARLQLRGFMYDTLENDHVSVQERLRWLRRHADGYTPQIYDQLAAAYRRTGQESAARKVGIAKQWHRRSVLNVGGKLLNWLLYATVGYGYRTWLAGAWLIALLTIGTWVFSGVHMIATSSNPPPFHPFAYTADVTLPIVNLGQKSAWEPQGAAVYCSWVLTGAGWVLTTAAVAGLTGILKRD
jgi:hypothetical protein